MLAVGSVAEGAVNARDNFSAGGITSVPDGYAAVGARREDEVACSVHHLDVGVLHQSCEGDVSFEIRPYGVGEDIGG